MSMIDWRESLRLQKEGEERERFTREMMAQWLTNCLYAIQIKKQVEAAVRLVNSPEGIKAMNEAAVVAEKTIEQIGRRGGWMYFRPWGPNKW